MILVVLSGKEGTKDLARENTGSSSLAKSDSSESGISTRSTTKVAKRQLPSLMSRERLLQIAGISEKDLASDLKKARKKLLDLTEAKETKFFSDKGKIRDIAEVDALEIQRKAAKDLLDLSGSLPGKASGGGSGPQQVVLIVEKPWVTTESQTGAIVDAKVEEE